MHNSDNKLENKLKVLKVAYLKKLENIIEDLRYHLKNISDTDLNEVYGVVHKVAGTSGMYGLAEISSLSNDFEYFLKEQLNSSQPESIDSQLEGYIQRLESLLEEERGSHG